MLIQNRIRKRKLESISHTIKVNITVKNLTLTFYFDIGYVHDVQIFI